MSDIKEQILTLVKQRHHSHKVALEQEKDPRSKHAVDLIARIREDSQLIELIDSLPEEKPSEDLEKAARRYAIPVYMKDVDENFLDEYPYNPVAEKAFIAGAEWQSDRGPVTEATATRPTAEERVAKVRADLERHGFDPFKDKSRRMKTVAMRHCVFLMLRREGYTQKELGDATGYDHSTVSWGEANARALVNLGDSLYTEVWNKVNMIDEGML